LNLPFVPPNSLAGGFHWESGLQAVQETHETEEMDSDKEMDEQLDRQLEEKEDMALDPSMQGEYDPLTGFAG